MFFRSFMKISGSFNNNVLNAVLLSLLTLFLQQQTESTSTSMLTLLAADSSTNNLQQFSVSLARTQCVPQRHFRTSKQTHLHPQFYTEFHLKVTHTHTRLTALFPGLPRWAGTRKVNPIWILPKQETVSGSGISWAICKAAPCSRQKTMPAPHHSVFYRPDALPAAQPTVSKHWKQYFTLK